jgi:hypothetical protein
MDGSQIFTKTALGIASYADANAALSQAERTLLIMIDGAKPMSEIRRFNAVLGDCDALAERLQQQGYIEAVVRLPASALTAAAQAITKTRLMAIQSTASRMIAHELGSYGNKLCGQIEAADNVETLKALCDTAAQVLASSKGQKVAAQFREEMEARLGTV